MLRTFQNLGAGATSLAFSPDSTRLLAGTWDNKLILWDVNTDEPLSVYDKGHSGPVMSVAFSPNGRRMVSGSADTAVRIWDAAKPNSLSLAGLFRTRDGEWLTMIKGGFFAGSRKGSEMLSVVREFESFSVLQFYDHLYRPDLVEESLRGEAGLRRADEAIEQAQPSGVAGFWSRTAGRVYRRYEKVGDTVKLTMRIVDTGGGIGPRVVWRVNGKTQGNLEPAALKGVEQPSPGRASHPHRGAEGRSGQGQYRRLYGLQRCRACCHASVPSCGRQVRRDHERASRACTCSPSASTSIGRPTIS